MQSQKDSIIEVDKLENMEYVEKELKNIKKNKEKEQGKIYTK